jgi:2-dehydro-3-deoxygalactonokinase
MGKATFVAGDWGTSHLRLFLCDAHGVALDTIDGPGASTIPNKFAETFDGLLADWTRRHGLLPAVLCGMVGSSFGWAQAPYLPCPARPQQIAAACVALRDGRVRIVPGLSCRNRLDAPDLLRGEETQLLGALQLEPALRRGRHLLCLPGTHTKWVVLDEAAVSEFITAPTGELFALLCSHSVLVRDDRRDTTHFDRAAFEEGVVQYQRFPDAGLLHRLFETRSRRLTGELAKEAAAPYLSGLLIANDVGSALKLLADVAAGAPVRLIGAEQLTRLYAMALGSRGRESRLIDGAAASLAGLAHVHRLLSPEVAALEA